MRIYKEQSGAASVGPTASALEYGQPFKRADATGAHGPLFIRVKPTGFLLNSNILGDVLNRGDILTVNLEKNTLYYMKGDTPVVMKEAHIVVVGEQS